MTDAEKRLRDSFVENNKDELKRQGEIDVKQEVKSIRDCLEERSRG